MLVGFCHLPAPELAEKGGALSAGVARGPAIICSASGARSVVDTGAFGGLPSLFHRVPPPDHTEPWNCPACSAVFAAALVILAVFVLRLPNQTRPFFIAVESVWSRAGLILHPHPTRGPPLALA